MCEVVFDTEIAEAVLEIALHTTDHAFAHDEAVQIGHALQAAFKRRDEILAEIAATYSAVAS